jgi:hypothetical protein
LSALWAIAFSHFVLRVAVPEYIINNTKSGLASRARSKRRWQDLDYEALSLANGVEESYPRKFVLLF